MEFEEFKKLRDKTTEALVKCEDIKQPEELILLGYTYINGASCNEDIYEHEFSIYEKGKDIAVFLQTYVKREGGMYYQSLYTSNGKLSGIKS
ncbi:hypothetical protein ACFLS7_00785 [Bacteroidota bacterium]